MKKGRGLHRIVWEILGVSLGVVCLASTETAPAAQRPSSNVNQVRVPANQMWTATGVYVKQNDRVAFVAMGEVGLSGDPEDVAGPAGSVQGRSAPGAPLRGALAGALIGRVGRSAPFGIGNQTVPLGMPATGELFLGVNDDGFGDNAGEFVVTIRGGSNSREREPPSSAQPRPADTRGVSVQANRLWTSTRLYVSTGDRVTFSASGQVRLSRDSDDTSEPAGSLQGGRDRGAPLPNELRGALIGRIGDSAPFGIGNQSRPLSMPDPGELFLGINDSHVNDNSGQYTVYIDGASTERPSAGGGYGNRVLVPADEQWTTTNIRVRSGERVRFNVHGRIRIGGNRPEIGPEGHVNEPAGSGAPMPGAPLGQLLGRIDNAHPFAINGSSREIRMPDSGLLSFGVNDTWVADNRGGFEVEIRR